jgi:hypothetical protein
MIRVNLSLWEAREFIHAKLSLEKARPCLFLKVIFQPHNFLAQFFPYFYRHYSGETLESMQVIEEVSSELTADGTQNELEGWLLSASFDGSQCFVSAGEFICNSIFLRCNTVSTSRDHCAGGGKPRPTRVCADACRENVEDRATHCIDTVQDGGILSPDVDEWMCDVKLSGVEGESFDPVAAAVGSRHFRDMPTLNEQLYPSDSECSADLSAGFSAQNAKQFVTKCPNPFVVNDGVFNSPQDLNFCVVPCPSFVYTEAEYKSMWQLYVALGLLALVCT